MEKIDKEKSKIILDVLNLVELIVSKNKLDSALHKDEIEKYFMNLLLGKDVINVYLRREAGISDERWKDALREFYIYIGINNEKYEQEIIDRFI